MLWGTILVYVYKMCSPYINGLGRVGANISLVPQPWIAWLRVKWCEMLPQRLIKVTISISDTVFCMKSSIFLFTAFECKIVISTYVFSTSIIIFK